MEQEQIHTELAKANSCVVGSANTENGPLRAKSEGGPAPKGVVTKN